MTTGTSVPLSTPSSVASLTATGRSSRIGRPQWPHFGRSVMRARSTRLRVAQNGQATVACLSTWVTDTAHLLADNLHLDDGLRLDLDEHLGSHQPAHGHERGRG